MFFRKIIKIKLAAVFVILLATVLIGLYFSRKALAQESEDDWLGIDLSIQDVMDILTGLACWLLRVSFAVMVIFLVLAGLRFMNARGDPTRYTGAKKNFTHVLIGIIVIMGVYVIIATVATAVGRADFSLIPLVC